MDRVNNDEVADTKTQMQAFLNQQQVAAPSSAGMFYGLDRAGSRLARQEARQVPGWPHTVGRGVNLATKNRTGRPAKINSSHARVAPITKPSILSVRHLKLFSIIRYDSRRFGARPIVRWRSTAGIGRTHAVTTLRVRRKIISPAAKSTCCHFRF